MGDAYAQRMTCDAVRDALAEGADLPESLRGHAETCEVCGALVADERALVRFLSEGQVDEAIPPALLGAVEADLAAERAPLQRLASLSTSTRMSLGIATTGLVLLGVLATTRRVDLAVYPVSRMVLALASLGLAGFVALRLALRPPHAPSVADGRQRALLGTAVAASMGLALMPAAHLDHPASLAGAGEEFFPRALACFLFGLGTGAPIYVVLRTLDRLRQATYWPVVMSVCAAALGGTMALQLHCPITHPAHLAAGHATVVVCAMLAAVAGWRHFGARARP